MPNIPTYRSRITADSASFPKIPSAYGQEGIATLNEASTQARDVGATLDYKLKQLKQVQDLGNATIDGTKRLSELSRNILNSPEFIADPEGHASTFESQAKAIQNEIGSRLTDQDTKVRWELDFSKDYLANQTQLLNAARKQRIVSTNGDRLIIRNEYLNNAVTAEDEDGSKSWKDRYAVHVGRVVSTGGISYDDAIKDVQDFESTIAAGRVRKELWKGGNTRAVIDKLNANAYPGLQQIHGIELLKQAESQIQREATQSRMIEEREERRRDKAIKESQDINHFEVLSYARKNPTKLGYTDIDNLVRTGKLSGADGRATQEFLDRQAKGELETDNPLTYREIVEDMPTAYGDPDSTAKLKSTINKSVASGLLKFETGKRLRVDLDSEEGKLFTSPDFKQAADMLKAITHTKSEMSADYDTDQDILYQQMHTRLTGEVRKGTPVRDAMKIIGKEALDQRMSYVVADKKKLWADSKKNPRYWNGGMDLGSVQDAIMQTYYARDLFKKEGKDGEKDWMFDLNDLKDLENMLMKRNDYMTLLGY